MVGSLPRGSDANGTTAAAPGCRMISSWPVDPSGKRTVSMSRLITRPEWTRLLAICIGRSFCLVLKRPGKGHLEPLGEEVSGVAPHVRVDGRAGGGRRVRGEPQAPGDDSQSQHVKAVAHEEHAAALPPPEPALHLLDRGVGVMASGERNDRLIREAEPGQIVPADVGLVE